MLLLVAMKQGMYNLKRAMRMPAVVAFEAKAAYHNLVILSPFFEHLPDCLLALLLAPSDQLVSLS